MTFDIPCQHLNMNYLLKRLMKFGILLLNLIDWCMLPVTLVISIVGRNCKNLFKTAKSKMKRKAQS